MNDFDSISEILRKRNVISPKPTLLLEDNVINGIHNDNVNTDIKNINYNDSNVNKYALDKTKFKPNTEETQLAEEIAAEFGDLENYASYLKKIKVFGCEEIIRCFRSVKENIKEKANTKTPVRKKAAYFMWILKNRLY